MQEPLAKRYALATEPDERMALACATAVRQYSKLYPVGTIPDATWFMQFFRETGCLERERQAAKTEELHWLTRHEIKGREEFLHEAEDAQRIKCEAYLAAT